MGGRITTFSDAADDFKQTQRTVNMKADKSLAPKFSLLLELFVAAVNIEHELNPPVSFEKLCKIKSIQDEPLGKKSNLIYHQFDHWELTLGNDNVQEDILYVDPAADSEVRENTSVEKTEVYTKSIDRIKHPLDA